MFLVKYLHFQSQINRTIATLWFEKSFDFLKGNPQFLILLKCLHWKLYSRSTRAWQLQWKVEARRLVMGLVGPGVRREEVQMISPSNFFWMLHSCFTRAQLKEVVTLVGLRRIICCIMVRLSLPWSRSKSRIVKLLGLVNLSLPAQTSGAGMGKDLVKMMWSKTRGQPWF